MLKSLTFNQCWAVIRNCTEPFLDIRAVLRVDNTGSQKIKCLILIYNHGCQKIKYPVLIYNRVNQPMIEHLSTQGRLDPK
jgi:hypothetical protein